MDRTRFRSCPAIPTDIDMNRVRSDVGDEEVSAPAADVPELKQVVVDARHDGVDLKIVVIGKNPPPVDTPLRYIATEVGHAYPGSTELVLSPSYAGTYRRPLDRVILEAGQYVANTGDPVQSSKNFVNQLSTPRLSVDRMSLRGHGRSPTSQPLLTFSIVDYVKDVWIADGLAATPFGDRPPMGWLHRPEASRDSRCPCWSLGSSVPPRGTTLRSNGGQMSTLTDLAKRWNGEIKAECRRQGLRFVADHAFLVDEVYLATLWTGQGCG